MSNNRHFWHCVEPGLPAPVDDDTWRKLVTDDGLGVLKWAVQRCAKALREASEDRAAAEVALGTACRIAEGACVPKDVIRQWRNEALEPSNGAGAAGQGATP